MRARRPHEALVAIGSNVEPERNVPRGLEMLGLRFALTATSTAYRTPPVGGSSPQPDFVNLVVRIRTDLAPRALREACRRIEERCGRRRTADRYAPRTLDLDVVLFDDVARDYGSWRLPDPDLCERAFVLVPAAEVAPAWVHPEAKRTLAALRDTLAAEAAASLKPWPVPRVAAPSRPEPA